MPFSLKLKRESDFWQRLLISQTPTASQEGTVFKTFARMVQSIFRHEISIVVEWPFFMVLCIPFKFERTYFNSTNKSWSLTICRKASVSNRLCCQIKPNEMDFI